MRPSLTVTFKDGAQTHYAEVRDMAGKVRMKTKVSCVAKAKARRKCL
ncbi:MAG: hypothetical protein VCA38_07455 [Roseibacillus sp.]